MAAAIAQPTACGNCVARLPEIEKKPYCFAEYKRAIRVGINMDILFLGIRESRQHAIVGITKCTNSSSAFRGQQKLQGVEVSISHLCNLYGWAVDLFILKFVR